MNVNEKGVRGLIKVIDDLQQNGYYAFTAFDDHSPIDLIAVDTSGNTFRIQVKYRCRLKIRLSDRYELSATSVVNGKKVMVDRDMIDGWAVYLKEDDKVVYIHKNLLLNKKTLNIDPSMDYGKLAEWSKALHC